MSIKILPPQLANQIAAGEVVERPSSVVKELVENALDAGATKIEIDIERGGHKKILIKDDGKGIDKDELALALSRHATSKISDMEDLEAIVSLGFRGEALASISSVSRLTITSKPKHQSQAWSAIAEGLDMAVDVKPAAHPNGSSVEVLDLFFNTPARRKFLRAEKTEFGHIETLIRRIAMSRPEIAFVLKHNGKTVKRFRSQAHLEDRNDRHSARIAEVINQQFVDNTSNRTLEYGDVNIAVWVREPNTCRTVSPAQYAFVNGRMMRDKLIQHAIRQAYADQLHHEQQPEYVLFIELPATDVDVNVHPAKHEVRFHHSRLLHDLIVSAFQEGLADFNQVQADLTDEETSKNTKPEWVVTPQQSFQSSNAVSPEIPAPSFSALTPTQIGDSEKGSTDSSELSHQNKRSEPISRNDDSHHQYAVKETQVSPNGLTFEKSEPKFGLKPLVKPSLTQLQLDECVESGETVKALHSVVGDNGETGAERAPDNTKPKAATLGENPFDLQIVHRDGDSLFIKLQEQMWLVDLTLLYEVVRGSDSLNVDIDATDSRLPTSFEGKDIEPTPLLVPVRIRLSQSEREHIEHSADVLSKSGFVYKLHNEFLIIKQVPSLIRGKNANRYLPQFFEALFRLSNVTEKALLNLLFVEDEIKSSNSEINKAEFMSNLGKISEELRILSQSENNGADNELKRVAYPLSGPTLLQILK